MDIVIPALPEGRIRTRSATRTDRRRANRTLAVPERLERREMMAAVPPDDALYGSQWNMRAIGADLAWRVYAGLPENVVAVMDYGLDFDHRDLAGDITSPGNLWDRGAVFRNFARRGYDEINNSAADAATKPAAGDFQGNHAAGIIGSLTNNFVGVAGINWRVRMFSSKIAQGTQVTPGSVITRAVDRIIGIRTEQRSPQDVRAVAFGNVRLNAPNLYNELRRLVLDGGLTPITGMLATVPVGDVGGVRDPGDLVPRNITDNVILVGAHDSSGRIWPGNANLGKVEIFAPGVGITSLGASPTGTASVTGTRQAASHVAGAITMLYGAARSHGLESLVGWDDVRQAIFDGARIGTGGNRFLRIVDANGDGSLRSLGRILAARGDIDDPDLLLTKPDSFATTITVTGGTVTEGHLGPTPAQFTFTLGRAIPVPITVGGRFVAGTATRNADFTAPVGANETFRISFAAGQTVATLPVSVLGDIVPENNETIRVEILELPDEVTTGNPFGEVTVVDDDAPSVSITGPVTVVEGDLSSRSVQFDVVLSNPVQRVTTVQWEVVAGTATPDSDVRGPARPATITFFPGQRSARAILSVVGDRLLEADETFSIVLSAPSGLVLGTATHAVTIIDDDGTLPVLQALPAMATAAAAPRQLFFTVTLTKPAATPVTVDFAAVDGTAANGVDFVLAAGTLTFAPGQRSQRVAVTVLQRRPGQAYPKTFTLRLSKPVGLRLSSLGSAQDVEGRIV